MPPGSDPASLRVGLTGFGLAGEVFHAPLITATSGLELAAIVTRDPQRSERARARYPETRIVSSADEMWGRVDLAVIAAPNRLHAELGLAAIDHGLPVVIDKPLAATVPDAERILVSGGRVTVFQNRRWDGDFLTVQKVLQEGRLGRVFRFDSSFERFRPLVGQGWRESGEAEEGGGQIADLGAHLIDQAVVLLGPPVKVYAEIDQRRPGALVDDDVFLALEHAGGERSHLHMGKVAPIAGPRFRIAGTEGGLSIDGLDSQEAQLGEGMLPTEAGYGERGPGRIVIGSAGEEEPLSLEAGNYAAFYSGVVDWIRDDASPPVDPMDSLLVMRIIEAARTSAAKGQVVAFENR